MVSKKERVIFHVDVNCAFLSWSAVHKLKNGETTDLRKIPSIVGGDEKARHGVVLAKSDLAKKYGIVTGESIFSARRKCPNLTIVSPSFEVYRFYSRSMFKILSRYTELIEQYSIDEGFMDLTDRINDNPVQTAYRLKERIKEELGFTVNVGISENKLLAKMASELKKPDTVMTLHKNEIRQKLWPLPVNKLFMVGRKAYSKLEMLNINTVGELANYDINILKDKFKSYGELIWNYANGIDDSRVESSAGEAKFIGNSATLAYDVKNRNEALKVIKELTLKVVERLKKSNRCCSSVTVNIRTSDFEDYSHQKRTPELTNSCEVILKCAEELFDEMWKKEPIRLLGVSVSGLKSKEFLQISLFQSEETEKEIRLEETLDSIKAKFGENSIGKLKNFKKTF